MCPKGWCPIGVTRFSISEFISGVSENKFFRGDGYGVDVALGVGTESFDASNRARALWRSDSENPGNVDSEESSATYLLGVEYVCRDPDESLVGRKIELSGEDTRYVALDSSDLLDSPEVSRTFVSSSFEDPVEFD